MLVAELRLTEDEDRALLKEEHGLPLTEEDKKLLKRAIKKLKNRSWRF